LQKAKRRSPGAAHHRYRMSAKRYTGGRPARLQNGEGQHVQAYKIRMYEKGMEEIVPKSATSAGVGRVRHPSSGVNDK